MIFFLLSVCVYFHCSFYYFSLLSRCLCVHDCFICYFCVSVFCVFEHVFGDIIFSIPLFVVILLIMRHLMQIPYWASMKCRVKHIYTDKMRNTRFGTLNSTGIRLVVKNSRRWSYLSKTACNCFTLNIIWISPSIIPVTKLIRFKVHNTCVLEILIMWL